MPFHPDPALLAPALFRMRLALKVDPSHEELRRQVVENLVAQNRWPEAWEAARELPVSLESAKLQARVLVGAGRYEELFALAEGTGAPAAFLEGLGLWAGVNDLWEGVEACCRKGLSLVPASYHMTRNLMVAVAQQGRLQEAEALARQAQTAFPDLPEFRLLEGEYLLLQGRMAEGFAAWEARMEREDLGGVTPMPLPFWDGGPLEGRNLLLRWEQGFGDVVMMVRFVPALKALGAGKVWMDCHEDLDALMATMAGLDGTVHYGDTVPLDTLQVSIMSLPRLLGLGPRALEEICPPGAYLQAPETPGAPALREALRALGPRPRIGLAWKGNSAYPRDLERSIDPGWLQALAGLDHLAFVSLQRFDCPPPPLPHLALAPWLTCFGDMAVALSELDLVISVDTSVNHLAGALGRPGLILLSRLPDWRWRLDYPDSTPWYPTLRPIRQQVAGDWGSVMAEVRGILEAKFPA